MKFASHNVNFNSSLQSEIAEGNVVALKKLHECYAARLFHLAFAIINSRQMAEEIVEDVFIKIWEQRAKITEIQNLQSYLFVLTKNISIDYFRKSSGKNFCSLEEVNVPLMQVEFTPEDLMISAEIIKKINFAINDLPPKCRLIFKLVKGDGLKHREVAKLLNIHIKTVEAQMAIALKKIHTSIRVYLPDYSE